MKNTTIEWDDDALAMLKKAPFFIRGIAQGKVEKAAIKLGESRITLELFEKIKREEMGRS
jgi:hypothetical protein